MKSQYLSTFVNLSLTFRKEFTLIEVERLDKAPEESVMDKSDVLKIALAI